jgi:hypothetical protein
MSFDALREVPGMARETEWRNAVKGTLKAEMKRRGLTYEQLAERLAAIGEPTDPHVLRNKVNRGLFSAVFLFQCLKAMGVRNLSLDE